MSQTITLNCKAGHTWERPVQRGKKPHYCPQHAPVKAPAKPRDKVEQVKNLTDGRKKAASAVEDAINAQVAAALAGRIDPETESKLAYVYNELRREDGPRSGDLVGLRKTRRDLMRQIGKPIAETGSEKPEKDNDDGEE
jgi:hypothetical protein